MGKKKKTAPQGATPEEEVRYMIDLSRETQAKGQTGSAVFQAEEAVRIAKSSLGFDNVATGHAMLQLGFLYIAQGKPGRAKTLLEQAGEVADQVGEPGLRARSMELLAECALQDKHTLKKSTKLKNAQQFYRMAEEVREKEVRRQQQTPQPRPQQDNNSGMKRKAEDAPSTQIDPKKSCPSSSGILSVSELMSEATWTEVEYAPPTPEEIEVDHGVPLNLSEYEAVDASSGWKRHRNVVHWLYHSESEVFYNSEVSEYYRIENGQPVRVNEKEERVAEEAGPKVQRKTGTVKYFIPAKDYGFVVQEDGPDLYIRKGSQTVEYRAGQTVEYTVGQIDGRTAAVDVVVTEDVFENVGPAQAEDAPEEEEDSKPEKRMDREGVYQAMSPPAEWDKLLRAGDATLRGRQLHNEDRVTERRDGQLGVLGSMFGLYDGHGGHECAEYCRLELPVCVYKAYREAPEPHSGGVGGFKRGGCLEEDNEKPVKPPQNSQQVEDALSEGIAMVDRQFLQEAKKQDLRCGTTAVQCLVHGQDKSCLNLTVANVGDSRIVLCRGGKAVRLSEDHKPNRKDEKLRIERAGGTALQVGNIWRVTKGKGWGTQRFNLPPEQLLLATSRTIGDIELKDLNNIAHGPVISTPEVNSQKIGEEDFFVVLGSDGVWDHMTDQEAVDIGMEYYGRPQEAARRICQSSFDKESEDNITALVVRPARPNTIPALWAHSWLTNRSNFRGTAQRLVRQHLELRVSLPP